jgi:hypothetical protein
LWVLGSSQRMMSLVSLFLVSCLPCKQSDGKGKYCGSSGGTSDCVLAASF